MNIENAILQRRSVRQYEKGAHVSQDDLHRILRSAMYAPSAMNRRPWEFFIVTEESLLQKIQSMHSHCAFLSDAGMCIVVCIDTEKEHENMGIIDVSLASQNLMLEAYALGYGTCYCGISEEQSVALQQLLSMPKTIKPSGLIVLGKPLNATEPTPHERFNPNAVHLNKW